MDTPKGEYENFPSKFFWLTLLKTFAGESSTVAILSGIQNVSLRGGRSIKVLHLFFLSHSAENFRRGILHCCNNFGYCKSLVKREGEYQDFPLKVFCLTVPNNSVGDTFFCNNFGYQKGLDKSEGGGIKIFGRKFLVSQCRKISKGNLSVFHYFRISKNFMPLRGISKFSMEYLLSHSAENIRRGTLLRRLLEKFK